MSAVSANNLTTPSKKVAAQLEKVDMNKTPSKPSVGGDFDDSTFLSSNKQAAKKAIVDAASTTNSNKAEEALPVDSSPDDVYGKFVGDVDLPEEEEPLLIENSRRFVLFPIRYNEVGCTMRLCSLVC